MEKLQRKRKEGNKKRMGAWCREGGGEEKEERKEGGERDRERRKKEGLMSENRHLKSEII